MPKKEYGIEGKKEARGWRAYYPYTTGEFIRDYLQKEGEAYIHETWMAFQDDLREYGLEWWGKYSSFRRYFYILKKLGLIEFTREEPSEKPQLQPRRYYRVVPEYSDLKRAWRKPQVVMYPETVWGKEDYKNRKREAEELGISVRELTLRERPELREIRRKLGVE